MSARHSRLFAVLATIAAALHAPGGGGGGGGGGAALAQTLYALQDLQGNPAHPWAISADA